MKAKRIEIEKQASIKDIYLYVSIIFFLILLLIITLCFWGYNTFAITLISLIATLLIVCAIHYYVFLPIKIKYLSDIYITKNNVSLIYKIQDKIVEQVKIKKTEIESFKVDINIEPMEEVQGKSIYADSYLRILVTLKNGKKYLNNHLYDFEVDMEKEFELNELFWEEKISKIENPDKRLKLQLDIDSIKKFEKEKEFVKMSPNLEYLFNFISYENLIPNCELNININHDIVRKEVDYFFKTGKRLPYLKKIFMTVNFLDFIMIFLCLSIVLTSVVILIYRIFTEVI